MLLTADHGNVELMKDPVTGEPHTAHTTNPVPLYLERYGRPQLEGDLTGHLFVGPDDPESRAPAAGVRQMVVRAMASLRRASPHVAGALRPFSRLRTSISATR